MANKPTLAFSPRQVHAVLLGHVRAAGDALRTRGKPSDEAVHEARRRLKRARASLRLLRPIVGDEAYRRENACLRDAARRLSPVRDAAILEKSLAEIVADLPARESFASLRSRFLDRGRAARRRGLDRHAMRRMVESLQGAIARIGTWQVDDERGRERVLDALERLYRKGREALAYARAGRSAEALHEARKQVKYLELALEPFRPHGKDADKSRIGRVVNEAEAIEDRLGDDHDLAVLREQLAALLDGKPKEAEPVFASIEARQQDLRAKALGQARKLYRKKPARFRKRIERGAKKACA